MILLKTVGAKFSENDIYILGRNIKKRMIKTIFLGMCFLSISFIGFIINKSYKKRSEFYKDYYKYITIAVEGIRNAKLSKEEIRNKAIRQTAKDFGAFLEVKSVPKYIKPQEANEINDFFERFGAIDLESTMELLQDKKTEVEGKVVECEKQEKSKGGLIMKLCVLGGIALVIILV